MKSENPKPKPPAPPQIPKAPGMPMLTPELLEEIEDLSHEMTLEQLELLLLIWEDQGVAVLLEIYPMASSYRQARMVAKEIQLREWGLIRTLDQEIWTLTERGMLVTAYYMADLHRRIQLVMDQNNP